MSVQDIFGQSLFSALLGDIFGAREQEREYQYAKKATQFANRDSYAAHAQWSPYSARVDQATTAGEWMSGDERARAEAEGRGDYGYWNYGKSNKELQEKGFARFTGDRQDDWRLERQGLQYDAEFNQQKRQAEFATDLGLEAEGRSQDQRFAKLQALGLTPQEILGAGNPGFGGSSGGSASFTNVTPPEVRERQRAQAATAAAQQKTTALQAMQVAGSLHMQKREQDRKDKLVGPEIAEKEAKLLLTQLDQAKSRAQTKVLLNQAKLTDIAHVIRMKMYTMSPLNNIGMAVGEKWRKKGLDFETRSHEQLPLKKQIELLDGYISDMLANASKILVEYSGAKAVGKKVPKDTVNVLQDIIDWWQGGKPIEKSIKRGMQENPRKMRHRKVIDIPASQNWRKKKPANKHLKYRGR